MNAVFLKSLAIANELENGSILLTFNLAFMPRPSKYIGIMTCISKEHLSGLVNSIPACHFSVSLESASKSQG